jgi:hypothetical protein
MARLSSNFSVDRLTHLKEVVRKLYPEKAFHGASAGENQQSGKYRGAQIVGGPF